ncbi:MAG: HAD family hydrolase [Deltaproteobacteria bacterium]|nr:HAD family hydrolase [Deltaproteobacteria bacterium]
MKAILFDFGQTLVNSADGFKAAEKDAKEKLYAELDPDEVPWDRFLGEYRKRRKAFHQQSNFSRPAIWQAVCEPFGLTPDRERLQAWESDYWETVKSLTTPFPETMTVLEKLRERFRLGLVTNTQGQKNAGTHRLALFPRLERFFEVVVVAGEGGVPPKPDPEPFNQCLQRMDLAPQETLYVGDDWRIDICGARDAGLRPVWLKHRSVKRNWPDVEPFEPTITGLEQLLDLPIDD